MKSFVPRIIWIKLSKWNRYTTKETFSNKFFVHNCNFKFISVLIMDIKLKSFIEFWIQSFLFDFCMMGLLSNIKHNKWV